MEGKFTELTVDIEIKDGVLLSFSGEAAILDIPGSVSHIGPSAFENKGVETVSLPEGLQAIDSAAFRGCERLKSIKIPHGVEVISEYAFFGCVSIRYAIIPESVRIIGEGAFENANEELIIVAPYGSYAYTYAVKNKLPICESEAVLLEVLRMSRTNSSELESYELNVFAEQLSIPSSLPLCDEIYEHYISVSRELSSFISVVGSNDMLMSKIDAYVGDCFKRIEKRGVPVSYDEVKNRLSECVATLKERAISYRATAPKTDEALKRLEFGVIEFADSVAEAEIGFFARAGLAHASLMRGMAGRKRRALAIASGDATALKKEIIEKAICVYPYNPALIRIAVERGILCDELIDFIRIFNINLFGGGLYNLLSRRDFFRVFDIHEYVEGELDKLISRESWERLSARGVNPAPLSLIDLSECLTREQAIDKISAYLGSCKAEKERLYNEALSLFSAARTNREYRGAIEAFKRVEEFGDSREKIAELEAKMKRKTTLIALIGIISAALIFSLAALLVYLGGAIMPIFEDKGSYYAVVGYRGFGGECVIPDEYEGKPVTALADNAFSGCKSIKSVTIPGSITDFGSNVFWECDNLERAVIGEGVVFIGEYAFYRCRNLSELVLPEGLKAIEDCAFLGCESLNSLEIPESVTDICYNAFLRCSSLAKLEITENTISIGEGAFERCSSLKSVKLGKNVRISSKYTFTDSPIEYAEVSATVAPFLPGKTIKHLVITSGVGIGEDAFYDYEVLKTVSIPSTLTSISSNAFAGATSLLEINVSEGNEQYKTIDGSLYTTDGRTLLRYTGGSLQTSFEVPYGVETIGAHAFRGAKNLSEVIIPDSTGLIGEYAFYDCDKITHITIPSSIYLIDMYAFSDCNSLRDVEIKEGVYSLGYAMFKDCTALTRISIPESVGSINISLFDGCIKLANVALPQYLSSIGSSAFRGCKSLSDISLPQGITTIGSNAFEACTSLKKISLPSGITNINDGIFKGCISLESVTFGAKVADIGYGVFKDCDSLKAVYYPGTREEWMLVKVSGQNEVIDGKIFFAD